MSVTLDGIPDTEQAHNDAQFNALNPVNGFVSGNQAREVFMKSGLSLPVLAQVWQLADYNKVPLVIGFDFELLWLLVQADPCLDE